MATTVTAKLKDFFFDRDAVKAMIGEKQAKFLNHAGGYVRRVARNSIKLRGKARKKNTTKKALQEAINQPASPPGSPPYAHSDSDVTTLRNIQYGYNADHQSIVVGPLKLNAKVNSFTAGQTVPNLHEQGGSQIINERLAGKNWVPVGRRKARPGQPVRRRLAQYPKRPFMRPAMEKSAPKFPSLFLREG